MMNPSKTLKRPRNSYFFHIFRVSGVFQLHAGYKTTKLVLRPLSLSKPEANVKIPFGPVSSCAHRTKNLGSDEEISEFKLSNNRRQDIAFKDTLLNNMQLGDNSFNKLVTSLSTGKGNRKALALYISLINRSEEFIYHKEGVHAKNGFFLDDSSVDEQLRDVGGSIDELMEFIISARESALEVYDQENALDLFRTNLKHPLKRKIEYSKSPNLKENSGMASEMNDDSLNETSRLTKVKYIEVCERKELEDGDGLEKVFQSSFCGLGQIPIDNIEIPPQLETIVASNTDRVEFIKTSIRKRYNPASSTLVVCPVNLPLKMIDVNGTRKIDFKNQKFYVVQKIKCLKAFKDLDEVGEFSKLYGHKSREVLCYVLRSNASEVIQFGNLKDNLVSGQFARKTAPQDLFHHFHCLMTRDINIKAFKVVERMCRLCCIGPEETTAIKRICRWSINGFQTFMKILEEFESYKTADVSSAQGIALRISKGEKLNLSNSILRQLGKCPESYFLENCKSVSNGAISLKELVANHQKIIGIEKVYMVLCKIADYQPIETLKRLHPGKFDENVMKEYVGAVFSDQVKNSKTNDLEKYFNFVINCPADVSYEKAVEFKTVQGVEEVFEDLDLLIHADLIVFNVGELDLITIKRIVDLIRDGNKVFHAAIFLFPTERDYFKILCAIRNASDDDDGDDMDEELQIWPLIFNKQVQSRDKFLNNVQHGFIFGKFMVLKPPLLSLYSDVSMLCNVVQSICPSGSRVLSLSHPSIDMIKLHDEELFKVTYCGDPSDIRKFRKKMEKVSSYCTSTAIEPNMNTDTVGDNVASTSTTPLKDFGSALKKSDGGNDVYNFDIKEEVPSLKSHINVSKALKFDAEMLKDLGTCGSSLANEFADEYTDFGSAV